MTSVEKSSENSGKRDLFIWKPHHEDLLLREVLVLEPYQHRPSSKERGTAWRTIAENLQEAGMRVTHRSVRERFDKLVKDFKRKEAMENRASGVEVDYTDRDKAMVDILERMSELELAVETQKEKEKADRASAEEMRKRATERLGETRRRHSEELDSDDGDMVLVTPERKRRRSSEMLDVLKGSLEVKTMEQEQAQQLRQQEISLLKSQMLHQQQFQRSVLEQQQQFQQQQQAVTLAIVNTLAELVKNVKK